MDSNFYKQLIKESPTGYAYHKMIFDKSGMPCDYEFIDVNKSFERCTGLHDVIGKKVSDVMPGIMSSEFDWIKFYGDIAVNRSKKEFEQYSEQLKRWYRITVYSPVKNYFVTYFIDISKEKTSAQRYRLLVENSHDIIYRISPQGIFTFISPVWTVLLGHKVEDVVGKSFQQFVHPGDIPACNAFLQKALQSRQRQEGVEYRIRHINGSWRWHTTSASPLKNELGETIGFVATGRDISERKRSEEIIFNEKELFKTTLLSVGDGVVSTDSQGNVSVLNGVAEQLTGWTQEESFGKPLEEVFNIINEFSRERCDNPVNKVLETGNIIELANHTILISKDGSEIPVEDSAAPIKDSHGNIIGVVLVFRDFTEKKVKQDEIHYLSYHDQLTGLYNRRYYEQEVQRLDSELCYPLTLVMADVNGLKLTNDAFGHIIGDELLKRVSNVLKRECRQGDVVARIGGDEFVILLPKTDVIDAEILVNRIHFAMANEKIDNVFLSVSIGFAVKENESVSINEIFMKAEDDMYRHKLSESSSMRSKTIDLILNSLFEKNEREMYHSRRVGELCEAIATKMNFDKDNVSQIKIAGLMHDIGKIGIADNILNKAHKLNDSEWNEIERHSEIGYRILNSVSEFSKIAVFVLEHHEKWDGTGYPKALKGEETSIQARIIAVADAYDAMTSDRTYRNVLSDEDAIAQLKKFSGIQFDSNVVKVFVEQVLGMT